MHGNKDGADNASGDCGWVECCADNRFDGACYLRTVEKQKQHAGDDIDNGHNGYDVHGYFGDALETADDDGCRECGDEKSRNGCRDAYGIAADVDKFTGIRSEACHGACDAVDLRDGTDAKEACANAKDCEHHGKPFHVPAIAFLDACFDVVEWTA